MKPPSTRLQLHPPNAGTARSIIEDTAVTEAVVQAQKSVRPWIENDIEILTEILSELRKERVTLEERHHRFLTQEREAFESYRAEYERTRDQVSEATRQLDDSRRELDNAREQLLQDVVRWHAEPEHAAAHPQTRGADAGGSSADLTEPHHVRRQFDHGTTTPEDRKLGTEENRAEEPVSEAASLLDQLGKGLVDLGEAESLDSEFGVRPVPQQGSEISDIEEPSRWEGESPMTASVVAGDATEPSVAPTGRPSSELFPPELGFAEAAGIEELPSPTEQPSPAVSEESSEALEFAEPVSALPPYPEEHSMPGEAAPIPDMRAPESSLHALNDADDEVSLEDYLAQFTQRFGISEWAPAGQEIAELPDSSSMSQNETSSIGHGVGIGLESAPETRAPAKPDSQVPPKPQREGAALDVSSPRKPPADLNRMRNLANLSSERVLLVHQLRTLKNQAKNQLALAAGAFLIGATLMAGRWILSAPDVVVWFASAFFVGASAFVLSHLWSTKKASDKRKELSAIAGDDFEDFDEDEDALDDPLASALPEGLPISPQSPKS